MKVNKPGGTINIPPIYRTGLLLLVEVKKASPACQMFEFLKVMEQTDQQSRHAFAYYPRVSIFGMVIAIGDLWLYREYYREDLRPSPNIWIPHLWILTWMNKKRRGFVRISRSSLTPVALHAFKKRHLMMHWMLYGSV